MLENAIAALLVPFLGGASLHDNQLQQLRQFLDLLLHWNARMNLTAVRAPEQIVTRHFGESLFAATHLYPANWKPETGNWKLLDLGSGAGFPGLPIKIWAPPLRVTLVESNQRKATFLREVVRALQLSGVEVLATRAESREKEWKEGLLDSVAPGVPAGAVPEDGKTAAAAGAPPAADLTVALRAVERFHQILPTAVRLLQSFPAPRRRLALLIGAPQVETAHRLAPALTWTAALPIPASAQRVLLLGHLQP